MARSAKQYFIYQYFLLLFAANFILVGLAVYFYSDHFYLWTYPFSYAGMEKTYISNLPNTVSMILYGLAMLTSGIIMLILANKLRHDKSGRHGLLTLLTFIAGIGFIIAGVSPDDTRHLYHVIGSAIFVAMFWIIATYYLLKIRNSMEREQYYFWQLILQVPIFAYAITYFLNIEAQSTIQKFAFVALIVVLLYAINYNRDN